MKQTGPVRYKIFFHCGEELGLRTKVRGGQAWIDDEGLHIDGADHGLMTIRKSEILSAQLCRPSGTYRCIRVEHQGGRLFMSVIRFLIAGQFTLVNFYGTGELHQRLEAMTK